ncbi:MAG: hypothetical protein GTN71_07590 [Anaerolineae bacterium]|nr:hypothetical protein [Anaerolineae bacterium]
MTALRVGDASSSPLATEAELSRKLQTAGVCSPERLRLTIDGRYLFVDGFVGSVGEKLRVEEVCRQVAPESYLVNRLRVAVAEEPVISLSNPGGSFAAQRQRRYYNTNRRPIRRSAGHGTS